MSIRRNALSLLALATLPAGATVAQDMHAGHRMAAGPRCLGLPESKVAVQTYNFAGPLTGTTIPAEWDALPMPAKFQKAMPTFANVFGPRASKPTREQIAAVLKNIRDLGYRNVEGFDLISQSSPETYAELLKANGLQAIGNHTELDPAQWPARLAEAKTRRQAFVGSSGFGKPGFDTLEHTLETARNLNELGRAAQAQGLKLYVHNHDKELSTQFLYDRGDGKSVMTSAWEIVAANTDPRLVHFEVDVFWALAAFKPEHFNDLIAFLERNHSRIAMLHIKDLSAEGAMVAPGKGMIDWRKVVTAAGPQVAYYIIEYDLPSDAAKVSKEGYKYLTCKA